MSFKTLLRTIVFLAILFAVGYVSLNNQEEIAFSLPVAFAHSVRKPAALIYFGMFAAGVLAGTMLHGGGKKGGSGGGKK
jgi:hypothetical protein